MTLPLFTVLYGLVLAALFAYGVNGYLLLWLRRRYRAEEPAIPTEWPSVTVQIPVYNERDVAPRVIAATGSLEYPGPLEIQVLDDSVDDTTDRVAAALGKLSITNAHLRRANRDGFKAGALAEGLAQARGELLLVLDADFVPPTDFLIRTVPLFSSPDVGCVQARWSHLNRDEGPLTRGQALGIDVHFLVEKRARAAAGWPLAMNGSAGLWRKQAIISAGGWSADTLTEDLDLSYRAWLAGWRIVYADEVTCPAEVPVSMAALKAQQRRWARGSTETAKKLLGPIWRAKAPLVVKMQATLHLTHYLVHPLMLLSAALALPLGLLANEAAPLWIGLMTLAMATGGPLAMALCAAKAAGLSRGRRITDTLIMMVLGVGLALSTSVAVVSALSSHRAVFQRTPKGGAGSSYRAASDRLGLAELACGVGCGLLAGWLAARGLVTMTPFLALYAASLSIVGAATLGDGQRLAAIGRG